MMIYELLKKVCMTLEKHRIPYMVSGSIALNIYTVPRMTRDIDIVVVLEKEGIDRSLSDFTPGFYHHRPSIVEEIYFQYISYWREKLGLDTFGLIVSP